MARRVFSHESAINKPVFVARRVFSHESAKYEADFVAKRVFSHESAKYEAVFVADPARVGLPVTKMHLICGRN